MARTGECFLKKRAKKVGHDWPANPLVNLVRLNFLTKAASLLHPSHIYTRPHSSHSPPYLRLSLLSRPPLLQPLPPLPCAEARVKFTTTVKVRDDR